MKPRTEAGARPDPVVVDRAAFRSVFADPATPLVIAWEGGSSSVLNSLITELARAHPGTGWVVVTPNGQDGADPDPSPVGKNITILSQVPEPICRKVLSIGDVVILPAGGKSELESDLKSELGPGVPTIIESGDTLSMTKAVNGALKRK